MNTGLYVDIDEWSKLGPLSTRIYYYNNTTDNWHSYDSGHPIDAAHLPRKPQDMWPIRPVQR